VIFRLTSKQLRFLRKVARKSYPVEACALLFGKTAGEESKISKIEVTRNILQSSVRFEIDPETVVKAFQKAEQTGLQLVGIFHSHPAPSNPTTTDLQYMKLWPNTIWLILSTTEKEIAAFQMVDDRVQKLTLKIE